MTVLFVDDEHWNLEPLFDRLKNTINVVTATTCHEALSLFDQQKFDCVVSDLALPDGETYSEPLKWGGYGFGMDLLQRIRRKDNKVLLILYTVANNDEIKEAAQASNIRCYSKLLWNSVSEITNLLNGIDQT